MPMWFLQPSHQILYGISNLKKRQRFSLLFFFLKIFSLHVFIYPLYVWQSEDNVCELVLSFHYVGSGDLIQMSG